MTTLLPKRVGSGFGTFCKSLHLFIEFSSTPLVGQLLQFFTLTHFGFFVFCLISYVELLSSAIGGQMWKSSRKWFRCSDCMFSTSSFVFVDKRSVYSGRTHVRNTGNLSSINRMMMIWLRDFRSGDIHLAWRIFSCGNLVLQTTSPLFGNQFSYYQYGKLNIHAYVIWEESEIL